MYEVTFTSQFKHAVKRCKKRGLDVSKISKIVDLLRVDGKLPRRYLPHKLKGYAGNNTWECHIQPNWLLVWEQSDTQLTLLMLDTGTQADLFQ